MYGVYILLFERIILGQVLSHSSFDPNSKHQLISLTRVVFLLCQSGLILLNSARYVNYSEEAVRLLKERMYDACETPAWFLRYQARRITRSVMKTVNAGAKKVREALE